MLKVNIQNTEFWLLFISAFNNCSSEGDRNSQLLYFLVFLGTGHTSATFTLCVVN